MLKFIDVHKNYLDKAVLSGVSFEIQTGEFVFLVGPSGCGKTTAFKLIIKEEEVSSGKIFIDDYEIHSLKKELVPELRRQIGVVFQDYKLISSKNVFENIAFSLELMNKTDEEINNTVNYLLELVNLSDRAKAYQDELSGGEKQKVAIARAMATGPQLLLADEPTGNLDPISSWEVVDILKRINERGTTVIMATHEVQIVKTMNKRVLELRNGVLVKDGIADEYVTEIQKEEKQVKLDITQQNGDHTYIKQDTDTEVVTTKVNEETKGEKYKWSEWFNKEELENEHKKAQFVEEEAKEVEDRKEFEKNFYENVEEEIAETLIEEDKEKPIKVKGSIFKGIFKKVFHNEDKKVDLKKSEVEKAKEEIDVKPASVNVEEAVPVRMEKPKSRIKVSIGSKIKENSKDRSLDELDLPKKIIEILKVEGYDDIEKIKRATPDELINLDGIAGKGYEKIKKAIKN